MLRIPYDTEDFPAGTVANGHGELLVTWDDILWAAVTVGRPNRHYVFRHGAASKYEALFRWSLIRLALEQSGPRGARLRRTTAAKTLDPSEKGAVNYFLGLTFCKLFAEKCLNTPWLLHLDVFRPMLNPVLTGRSRPDLVGQDQGMVHWHAFECKGRVSPPDPTVKSKAKTQAQRLVGVKGTHCTLHIGAVTYFRGDSLHFYWRDPPPLGKSGIDIPMSGDLWMHYYGPVVEILRLSNPGALIGGEDAFVQIEGVDVKVGVHPAIARHLSDGQWEQARRAAVEAAEFIQSEGYQPDGLKVIAGESWSRPFNEPGLAEVP